MKFSCGLTDSAKVQLWKDKAESLRKWHKVFLWLPTTTGYESGFKICQWLCYVERRYPEAVVTTTSIYKGSPEYREVQK